MEIKEELSNYQKHKEAIYRWRNKNLDRYHSKMQQYNKTCYENNREQIIAKVRTYQQKKQNDAGSIKRKVGRPRKIYTISNI
jgi:uncharacterized protein YycO